MTFLIFPNFLRSKSFHCASLHIISLVVKRKVFQTSTSLKTLSNWMVVVLKSTLTLQKYKIPLKMVKYVFVFFILKALFVLKKPFLKDFYIWESTLRQLSFNLIIFWDLLMFAKLFFLPQVKWCAIVTYKDDVYVLPHALPKDSRLRS